MDHEGELRQLIDAEAERSEATKGAPIPAAALAAARRPNLARSVTFTLRLNPEELAGLQALAADRAVPASVLVRGWIARQLASAASAQEGCASGSAAAVVDRLEDDLRTLRKLVAS